MFITYLSHFTGILGVESSTISFMLLPWVARVISGNFLIKLALGSNTKQLILKIVFYNIFLQPLYR